MLLTALIHAGGLRTYKIDMATLEPTGLVCRRPLGSGCRHLALASVLTLTGTKLTLDSATNAV